MNISNHYWYFESAIPERICDMIVQYGKAEKEKRDYGHHRWFW